MQKQFTIASIIFLWLLHISAMIGIQMGYKDFFLPLTAYNLVYIAFLLVCLYPINKTKGIILFTSIAIAGYFFEVAGVATGQIFGEYNYGINLGPKLFDVPPIIGINWAVLCFVSCGIIEKIKLKSIIFKAALASLLMIFIDFFIEYSAPSFNFWEFTNPTVPIQNYVSWFIIAFLFNLAIFKYKTEKNFEISAHIYGVQLLFFAFFYVV
jgi:putative membrane protein